MLDQLQQSRQNHSNFWNSVWEKDPTAWLFDCCSCDGKKAASVLEFMHSIISSVSVISTCGLKWCDKIGNCRTDKCILWVSLRNHYRKSSKWVCLVRIVGAILLPDAKPFLTTGTAVPILFFALLIIFLMKLPNAIFTND